MRGHAAFPHAEYPQRVGHESAQPVFRQPVKEEFSQTSTNQHAQYADEGYVVSEFVYVHLEEFLPGEPVEEHVPEYEAHHIGQAIPADGDRGAGNIEDDGVKMVNIGGDGWHDRPGYSTEPGGITRQKCVARVVLFVAECCFFQKKRDMVKILLAKRGPIVYKYSIYLFFAMKRFFLPLAVAALCGVSHATTVPSADYAQASLSLKAKDAEFVEVPPSGGVGMFTSSADAKKLSNPAWHVLRIPYELRGKSRKEGKFPLYVDELKVHAYLLFAVGKSKKLILLEKEITYVDIPLPKRNAGEKRSENREVSAGVFISPADAACICAEDASKVEKVSLKGKLAAVAVEFKFKDADCAAPLESGQEPYVLIDNSLKSTLKKDWWKKEGKNTIGAELCAISETPFAPYYAPTFPATSPMYGSSSASGSYSASSSASSGMDGYVPASATDSAASADGADSTASDTTTAEGATDDAAAPKKKGKKRRRSSN